MVTFKKSLTYKFDGVLCRPKILGLLFLFISCTFCNFFINIWGWGKLFIDSVGRREKVEAGTGLCPGDSTPVSLFISE